MRRYLLRRALLALLSLWILSVFVFALLNLLPGNPGRAVLGNLADERAVRALNQELGYDQPLVTRYISWLGGVVRGDLGESYVLRESNGALIAAALWRSAKLAVVALVLVVPLSILGGVLAGLRRGRPTDRVISVMGLSGIAIPEFVSGTLLLFLFAIKVNWFPGPTPIPSGASVLTQLRYLILPAVALVIVMFGYIARMARAGTIMAEQADYTRTAILKGLPRSQVLRRYVLRNGLLPTITVIFTQIGYLIAGLTVVETTFNLPGFGRLIRDSIPQKDFPLLQSAILVVGVIYMIATFVGDVTIAALSPRIRLGDER